MFDVIVVGARCAGAPVSMLLARRGHRVALIDRATFPSDTMSTHFLWQRGASRLEAWGLLERLRARGCDPITELAVDFGPVTVRGLGPAVGGVAEVYCPRRIVLDKLLVDAAVEAGVELVEGCAIEDLTWAEGAVTGISGRRRSGGALSLQGRIVVGADGLHSTVARRAGAQLYQAHPALTCVYYSYWSGIKQRTASFHPRPGRLILVWPTNDDLTCVYVAWRHEEFRQFKTDIEGNFLETLTLVPGLRELVASGRRVERFAGTAVLPNQYRTSAGRGWALAGDAGHHKDPATGMGMSDALISAELLADAIDDSLAGREAPATALGRYAQRRDSCTANGFGLTLRSASLEPVPGQLLRYYEVAAGRPEEAELVLGALGGSIPFDRVYSGARIAACLR